MRRTPVPRRRVLALLGAAVALLVPVAIAGADTGEIGSSPDIGSGQVTHDMLGAWYVQLSGSPVADGGNANALTAKRQKFHADAKKAKITYTTRHEFQTLWNGVSLDIGAGQLEKVLALPNVEAIYPVGIVSIPETEATSIPDLATAIKMTGADIAQNDLGYTGDGVKVAVMDTGFDLDHADLGGDGVAGAPHPNSRVVAQWDLVGDAYNADPSSTAFSPTPVPDPVADDCNGHGTHVSGIVGADGDVTGVAPGVSFGAYRVFGCAGSTTDEIMIAAMERALADDMDVLNMSIGDAFNNWHQSPTGQASTNLVKRGVVVVASIGNSGANGIYSGGVPGMGDKVIGVASFDNSHVALNTFTISPDDTAIGYGNAAAAPPAPTSGSLPMAKANAIGPVPPNVLPAADGCTAVPAGTYTGMAVLVRRGTCTFHAKALNAMNGGAAAVVLYNNCPPNCGRVSPTVAGSPAITIPVVAISDTEGVLIHNRLAAGPVTLTWTDDTGTFTNPTGGLISSFSSYGLEAELDLKPDIGAPGGLIRSTYPLEAGGYATVSGTSMASPHVAGGVALLLEAKPNSTVGNVRTILQNSADPAPFALVPSFLEVVHRQGAGMLDIDDAILAETEVSPGKLALGESEAGPAVRQIEIWNRSKDSATYDLSFVNAVTTGGSTFAPSFFVGDASVAFSSSSVTVPAQTKVSFTATITPATGPAKGVYGGYIVLTPQGGGQTYRVPYAGFIGDYQSIVAATPTSFGFPWVARLTSCNPALVRGLECFDPAGVFTNAPGATFTMTNAFNVPQLLVHFDHQVRRMKVEVRHATTGRTWHLAFDRQYLARNSTSTGVFAFPFSGQTTGANGKTSFTVPDGTYVFRITIIKAGGSASNPAHTETLTTAQFTIDRP